MAEWKLMPNPTCCGAVARTSPCTDEETSQARRCQRTRLSKRCLHARTGRGQRQDEPRKQRTSTPPGGGVAGQYESRPTPSQPLCAPLQPLQIQRGGCGHRHPTPSGNEPLSRHAMSWRRERGGGCTRGWERSGCWGQGDAPPQGSPESVTRFLAELAFQAAALCGLLLNTGEGVVHTQDTSSELLHR